MVILRNDRGIADEVLLNLADTFAPVTLAELGAARLMNRTDTKFILPAGQLPELLQTLKQDYRWLEADGYRVCPYETMYFDTEDLRFYHDHRIGRPSRFKVRQRRYVQSGLAFTEVKWKTPQRRTVKGRIPCRAEQSPDFTLDEASVSFVRQQISRADRSPDAASLRPVLWVGYTRITLVHRVSAERLTFDLDLTFRNHRGQSGFPEIVIAECKQDARQTSPFLNRMREDRIRAGGLSKYCLGLLSLDPGLRNNRFLPRYKQLQRLIANCL